MSPRIDNPSLLSIAALLGESVMADSGSSGNYSLECAKRYAREAVIQHLSLLVVAGTIDSAPPMMQVIGHIPNSQTHRPIRLRSGLVTSIAGRDSWIHLADRTPETDPVIVDPEGWALPLNIEYYGRPIMAEARELALKLAGSPGGLNYAMSTDLHKFLTGIRANDIVAFADESDA